LKMIEREGSSGGGDRGSISQKDRDSLARERKHAPGSQVPREEERGETGLEKKKNGKGPAKVYKKPFRPDLAKEKKAFYTTGRGSVKGTQMIRDQSQLTRSKEEIASPASGGRKKSLQHSSRKKKRKHSKRKRGVLSFQTFPL